MFVLPLPYILSCIISCLCSLDMSLPPHQVESPVCHLYIFFSFLFIYWPFFFLKHLSHLYYVFSYIQCLVNPPWTCFCPYLKQSPQYVLCIFYFYFYLFTNLFFFLRIFISSPLCVLLYMISCLHFLDMFLSPLFDS